MQEKTKDVQLRLTDGLFRGLANQNMLFHQCIGELVDNSIAGTKDNKQFRIDIVLDRVKNSEFVDVWIADNTAGMDSDLLARSLQPGNSPDTGHRLNEHGFGLKNALATLCRQSGGKWDIWTRANGGADIWHVAGPFGENMRLTQKENFPEMESLPEGISTLICARTDINFVRTVRGRRRHKPVELDTLSPWLREHIGVHYRGYLEQDYQTGDIPGEIYVNQERVVPIQVPMTQTEKDMFRVKLGGTSYPLTYRRGVVEDRNEDGSKKHLYYYRRNMETQGIDIRLGRRVIATGLFKTIWNVTHDNHFNHFVGELLIPDLPPGILTTKSDKTDFNLGDQDWQTIFAHLAEWKPEPDGGRVRESELKTMWKDMLENGKEDGDVIGAEISLWESATHLDLCKKFKTSGKITIWELKRDKGNPLNLYQLKMYWDALVLSGQSPNRAVLLAEDFTDGMRAMAQTMNEKLHPPKKQNGEESPPYHFELETLTQRGLIDSDGKRKGQKR